MTMKAIYRKEGNSVDYTPVSAVAAGDPVVIGTGVFISTQDIAASTKGALASSGVFDVKKKAATAIAVGDTVYWDADGDPVEGTAGTGAATTTASSAVLMGKCVEVAAASGDERVRVRISNIEVSNAVASAVTADSITGGDSALTISGLAGSAGSAGGSVPTVGGAGDTNGAGGAVSNTGGAGAGSGAGGAVSNVGGAGGATGAGGAASLTGGAGGATSGTGGAIAIAGGAGTAGNANGGAVTINGGNAHGSGTDGAITIGGSNTSSLTLGVMPRIPTATVAAAGSVQGDAAALIEGFNLVTGADDTKGVILPAAVAGMQVTIKVGTGADLKVWPNTGDAINGIAANNAMTVVDDVCFTLTALDATTWYTNPLLPS